MENKGLKFGVKANLNMKYSVAAVVLATCFHTVKTKVLNSMFPIRLN